MRKKHKILLILFILVLILFSFGITYSIFNSNANIIMTNQNIAKFIFNAESSDHINLDMTDLNPGDKKVYQFSISNSSNNKYSDVTIDYKVIVKTLHVAPLSIKLYKLVDDKTIQLMLCDETYSRNEKNELVCNSSIQSLVHSNTNTDDYELEIEFPIEYNDASYANLVDYIDLEINSWQKIKGVSYGE